MGGLYLSGTGDGGHSLFGWVADTGWLPPYSSPDGDVEVYTSQPADTTGWQMRATRPLVAGHWLQNPALGNAERTRANLFCFTDGSYTKATAKAPALEARAWFWGFSWVAGSAQFSLGCSPSPVSRQ